MHHLHPIENANALESRIRKLLQNPNHILKNYISEGMTVLDLGCGTGFFTLEIAKLVGETGKVIASDVQQEMLDIVSQKLNSNELKNRIQLIYTPDNQLEITEKIDFVFAFYSFHEMKFLDKIIADLNLIIKPETKIYIAEQKFHVSKKEFESYINKMQSNGFEVVEKPRVILSRAVVIKKK